MGKFNVGDRVRCVVDSPEGNVYIEVGSYGTVVRTFDDEPYDGDRDRIGVEWDNYVHGHDCTNGNASDGYGWFVDAMDIEKVVFNIGDRVMCIVDHPYDNEILVSGMCGTVVCADDYTIRVDWDDNIGGHSCGGKARRGHGWDMSPSKIVFADEEEFEYDESSFLQMMSESANVVAQLP